VERRRRRDDQEWEGEDGGIRTDIGSGKAEGRLNAEGEDVDIATNRPNCEAWN
jgi:hypothetical protein